MPDSIRFDVFNRQTPNAGPVIYISDDAAKWGRLTIKLTNTSTDNSDLKLDPGGVLQIYLEMLTPDDIKTIKVPEDSAWTGGPDATNRHLELHPKSTITVPSQSSVSIELHNVLGKTPRLGKFRFYVQSLGIRNAVVQGFVQRPPGDDANQWDLACVLDPRQEYQNQGNTVYVTATGKPEIANYLLVHLYRSAGGTLPSTGTPQLSFSFLTGAGDLALCSEDRLKKVTASIQNQLPAGRWKDPAVDAQGEDTVWTVAPAAGGGDLFPEQALLTLRFDDIVTDLPAGGSAILFIQYAGLTGYDDGYIQVPLSKSAPVPYVRYFRAKADGKEVGANATIDFAALTLEWDVFAADSCLLKGDDESAAKTVALVGSKPLAPRPSQTYTLQPQVGSEALPGAEVQFHIAPPTADLTTGPDTSQLAPWTLLAWRGFVASGCGYMRGDGTDIPMTQKGQFNGVEMLSTGQQIGWFNKDNPPPQWYEIDRWCQGGKDGRTEATLFIGPAMVRWNCRSSSHCVLYADDVKVADQLPISGELPALVGTTYRVECIGVASQTAQATATPSAAPRASVKFVVAFGTDVTITWSVAGAGNYLRDVQVTAGDVTISDTMSGGSPNGTHTLPISATDTHYMVRVQGDIDGGIAVRQMQA